MRTRIARAAVVTAASVGIIGAAAAAGAAAATSPHVAGQKTRPHELASERFERGALAHVSLVPLARPPSGTVTGRASAGNAHARGTSRALEDAQGTAIRSHALILGDALSRWRAANPVAPPPPPPAQAPAPPPVPITNATSTDTPTWACIREYESGDVYNSPTEPSGAYGMLYSTWASLGYSGWPYQASVTVQNAAALYLYNEFGWTPWSTKTVCGL